MRRKYLAAAAAVLLIILAGMALFAYLHAQASYIPENRINQLDPKRSQVFVTGQGYQLDDEEQKEHKVQEQQRQRKLQEERKLHPEQKPSTQAVPRKSADPGQQRKGDNDRTKKPGGKDPQKASPEKKPSDEKQEPSDDVDKRKEDGKDPVDKDQDSKAPTIRTQSNIADGKRVNGKFISFWVTATDYKGQNIPVNSVDEGNYSVSINGTQISSTGSSGNRTTFRADPDDGLADGRNDISITVNDRYGNSKTFHRWIRMDLEKENEPIGEVHFTITAKALGLGTIKGSTTVEYYEGEQLSYVFDRFMEKVGLGYDKKGSLRNGFYLSRINKGGITDGYEIPDSIREYFEGETEKRHQDDSLGEKDFYSTSGWMIRVDGDFISTGLSGIQPEDGSDIEVCFTLTGDGKDVDGSLR